MIHSLEHLPAQRRALGIIHRILKEDGFICGIVPNFGSFCSTQMEDEWPWLDPYVHYCHFTPEILTKTLWMHGFVVHRCYTATGDFDRKILTQQIMKKDPRMPHQAIDKHIANLENSGRGEELRWFAQKI
jgi:predicted SAM-dependent methyltransferase